MLNDFQVLTVVLVIAVITFLTRALPFAIFTKMQTIPQYITFLGRYLPMAVIGMLVVYCFKDVSPLEPPYALAELLATITVIVLHLYKRNLLLSIIGGTGVYMLLVQKMG